MRPLPILVFSASLACFGGSPAPAPPDAGGGGAEPRSSAHCAAGETELWSCPFVAVTRQAYDAPEPEPHDGGPPDAALCSTHDPPRAVADIVLYADGMAWRDTTLRVEGLDADGVRLTASHGQPGDGPYALQFFPASAMPPSMSWRSDDTVFAVRYEASCAEGTDGQALMDLVGLPAR